MCGRQRDLVLGDRLQQLLGTGRGGHQDITYIGRLIEVRQRRRENRWRRRGIIVSRTRYGVIRDRRRSA